MWKHHDHSYELRKLGTHQWAGVVMGTIIELGEPRARVVVGGPGFVKVYGWTKELVTERGNVPMSELVSIHSFEWTARRAMRRWLREQTGVGSSSSSIPPLTKLGRSS